MWHMRRPELVSKIKVCPPSFHLQMNFMWPDKEIRRSPRSSLAIHPHDASDGMLENWLRFPEDAMSGVGEKSRSLDVIAERTQNENSQADLYGE